MDLKKKIIYRSNYRGTKEMDKLLGSFVKKHIDTFNNSELKLLCEFLDLDDDNLFKFKQNKETSIKIESNIITNLFKSFVFKE
tara:strand:+ start:1672 stop:1920 length:249 start_codon:yes stop_codon:yes gene_type:complete